ncbi:MAG: PLP-dependent aminotransferase family protein [Desulfobacteraceae bacterium]|nr:PLP-dependent aminotransferase family protein [Desulfobacteraceae bacterium]
MIFVKVDKTSNKPLYIQIRDQLEQAIREKKLSPGERLLPVASLAKEIGVTQTTVRRALEDLSKEGLTKCHVGRGTFVEDFEKHQDSRHDNTAQTEMAGGGIQAPGDGRVRSDFKFAAKQLRKGVPDGLCEFVNLTRKPGMIEFVKGVPDPGLFDKDFFNAIVKQTMMEDSKVYMDYGDCQGMPELRQEIAKRYARQGVPVSPEQILITNGVQQGVCIVALDCVEKQRRVICETPGYQGVPETFLVHGNLVDTVQRDEEGPLPEQLARFNHGAAPYLLYTCLQIHSPMGTDMSAQRQKALVNWARQNNGTVLCDDIFQDLRFVKEQPDSIFSQLGQEQTIVVKSLSKSLMSGLRVGWIISSAERINVLTRYKRLVDQSCPQFMQGIVLKLFQSGEYDAHVQRICRIYQERKNVMTESLQQMMPDGVTWTDPSGGFALWITLPEGYSSLSLLLSAVDKGVNFLPGPIFDLDQRFVKSLRLSWAWVDAAKIPEGIEILADTIKEMLRRSPGDSGLSGLGSF